MKSGTTLNKKEGDLMEMSDDKAQIELDSDGPDCCFGVFETSQNLEYEDPLSQKNIPGFVEWRRQDKKNERL